MPIKMKVCNVADYNESLKKRGKVFHLFQEATKVWFDRKVKNKQKSKFVYSDRLIQILAVFRYLFKYPYRQLEGLLEDFVEYKQANLPIPNFTTLCRRMAKLSLTIRDHRKTDQTKNGGLVDVIIDSTGINIYHTGGGHSKENGKFRQYKHIEQVRKMHVALEPVSKDVLSMQMSSGSIVDSDVAPILLARINCSINAVYADGAYDRAKVRQACLDRKAKQIIPPKKNAIIRKAKKREVSSLWDERNAAIKIIRSQNNDEDGRKIWKESHSYGKRSLVEAFFSRFKTIFGFHFMSRSEKARQSELAVKVQMLNSYNRYGTAVFKEVI
jgi:hypothetical protein